MNEWITRDVTVSSSCWRCSSVVCCWCSVLSSHAPPPPLFSGPDLRAGSGAWWIQEHPERPSSLRERPGRPRQIQNPATDQTGQHQAEDRRVWGLIRGPRPLGLSGHVPFLNGLYNSLLAADTHTHTRCRLNWSSISTAEASLIQGWTPVTGSSGRMQSFANPLKKI